MTIWRFHIYDGLFNSFQIVRLLMFYLFTRLFYKYIHHRVPLRLKIEFVDCG